MTTTPFDFVVFGATSFVGKILCQYLIDNYSKDNVEASLSELTAGWHCRKLPSKSVQSNNLTEVHYV